MPSILFSRAPRFIERTGPSLLSLPAVVFVGLLFLAPVVHLMSVSYTHLTLPTSDLV